MTKKKGRWSWKHTHLDYKLMNKEIKGMGVIISCQIKKHYQNQPVLMRNIGAIRPTKEGNTLIKLLHPHKKVV